MAKYFLKSSAIFLMTSAFLVGSVPVVRSQGVIAERGSAKPVVDKKQSYVPGEVIVKFKEDKINFKKSENLQNFKQFLSSGNLEEKTRVQKENISLLKIKDQKGVNEKIQELRNDPSVEYAEPNYKKSYSTIDTNDTNKDLLWGLDNTGQTVNEVSGTPDSDIDAPEAWSVFPGQSSVIVSIIDSGVAYNHPDLASNMWDGTNCKDENGNALGGCNHGYDFEDGDKTPLPTTSSHGTHLAGIIGAIKDNGKGVIGVNPKAKIMAVKFGLDVVSEIDAIDFSIQNGAKVINASFGGTDFSQAEYDAISRFRDSGGIFVAAAGNSSSDNDAGIAFYPASYDLDNIISVAATGKDDELASFSNFGATTVDVGAPGIDIYSTYADKNALSENFEEVTEPNMPVGWIKTGNWGTFDYQVPDGKVLYGDVNYPYLATANSTAKSAAVNLSGAKSATFEFLSGCDTEYNVSSWTDYMALEISSDGTNFSEIERWDEAHIDSWVGDADPSGSASILFMETIPEQYMTSNFKFRFRWVANGNSDTGSTGDGCFVDDISITKFTDGSDENYEFMSGTSMATPYVSGLAAFVWSAKSNLPYSQIKDLILNSGDAVDSLNGKTVSGKRINANNAINQITASYAMSPVATPASGTYSSNQLVSLSTPTEGAQIYYTTNGDTPTAFSILYSGAIEISEDTTLKAVAMKNGLSDSDVMSEDYKISFPSTIGIFRPSTKTWYLKDTNAATGSYTNLVFGASTDIPLSGDWNGDGIKEIGVFRPSTGTFYLKSNNSASSSSYTKFVFGNSTYTPIVGDWNGDGIDTVGVFRPSTKTWYLKATNAATGAYTKFVYGASTDKPIVGDWNGDGTDTIGVFKPSTGTFYLKNDNAATGAYTSFVFGSSAYIPIVGDWNGDGTDTIGVFKSSTKTWYLKADNAATGSYTKFIYGSSTDKPVVGVWKAGAPN